MSLSAGTLNLKFMQRAAARNAATGGPAATPAKARGPAEGDVKPSILGTPAAQQDLKPIVGINKSESSPSHNLSEDAARWTLPRRNRATPPPPSTLAYAVAFETSYLPFLPSGISEPGDAGPSRRAGGGRLAFGGFGEAPTDDIEQDGSGADLVDARVISNRRVQQTESERQEKKQGHNGKEKSHRARDSSSMRHKDTKPVSDRRLHIDEATGFARPSNYTPPVASSSRDIKPKDESHSPVPSKQSKADKLRSMVSNKGSALSNDSQAGGEKSPRKRPLPGSSSANAVIVEEEASPARAEKKARKHDVKAEPIASSAAAKQDSISVDQALTSSLDDREKALKAAKKKEKKERQKAKRASEAAQA